MPDRIQVKRVAIIAPLPDELDAILDAFPSAAHSVAKRPFAQFGGFLRAESGEEIEVLIFSPHAMGRAHAASLVTYILLHFHVDLLLVVGLCAALEHIDLPTGAPIALGDVIFADNIVEAEIRRLSGDRFEVKGERWNIAARLQEAARRLRYEPRSVDRAHALHYGTVVSVGSVLASTSARNDLRRAVASLATRPIAIEMEGNGILTAASIFDGLGKIAMIRGVLDYADETKNDEARELACRNSARVALEFVRACFSTP